MSYYIAPFRNHRTPRHTHFVPIGWMHDSVHSGCAAGAIGASVDGASANIVCGVRRSRNFNSPSRTNSYAAAMTDGAQADIGHRRDGGFSYHGIGTNSNMETGELLGIRKENRLEVSPER